MADITIQLEGLTGGDSSSSQYLKSTLDKLNAAIDKLASTTDRMSSGGGGGDNSNRTPISPDEAKNNQAWQQLGNKIGSVLATAVGVSLTAGIARYFNNQANAIMGRATAVGAFGAAAIAGNANSAFGNYASTLFSVEKARQIGNNNAAYESLYGLVGAAAGTGAAVAGKGIALLADQPELMDAFSVKGGAAAGGAIGAAYGKEQAAFKNAPIEVQMQIFGAIAKRRADASVSEWQTSFSRWDNDPTMMYWDKNRKKYVNRSSFLVAPGAITNDGRSINVPLNKAFEDKYGSSQNYNAILNGIIPYLNRSPMDSKLGNLDVVAQKFLKAGISVEDFGTATMQATKYQAITAKAFGSFADDYQNAIAKFGKGYDLNTNQSALNLLAMGYNSDEAQRIAYNTQYNSGMANSISQYANSTPTDFYSRQDLSKAVGFNLNATFATGRIQGASAARIKQLQKVRNDFFQKGQYDNDLITLSAAGVSPQQLASFLQAWQDENDKGGKAGKGSDKNAAQSHGAQVLQDYNNPATVSNMMVNATNVTILGGFGSTLSGGDSFNHNKNTTVNNPTFGLSPSAFGTNHSPSSAK